MGAFDDGLVLPALALAVLGWLVPRGIALVFPEELYDADVRPLPREAHDRTVDAVATPERWQCLRTEDTARTTPLHTVD